jgi:hypothetical protein
MQYQASIACAALAADHQNKIRLNETNAKESLLEIAANEQLTEKARADAKKALKRLHGP